MDGTQEQPTGVPPENTGKILQQLTRVKNWLSHGGKKDRGNVGDRYHIRTVEFVMEEPADPPEFGLNQFQRDKIEQVNTLLDSPPHIVRGNFSTGCGASIAIVPGVLEKYGGSVDEIDVRSSHNIQKFNGGVFIRGSNIAELPTRGTLAELGSNNPLIILEQLGNAIDFEENPEGLARATAALVKKDPKSEIHPRLFYTHGSVEGRDEALRFEEALKRELNIDSIPHIVARPKPSNDLQFREFVEAVYDGQGTAPGNEVIRGYSHPLTRDKMDELIAGCEQFLTERKLPKHLKIVREFVEEAKAIIHASGEYSMQDVLEETAKRADSQLKIR